MLSERDNIYSRYIIFLSCSLAVAVVSLKKKKNRCVINVHPTEAYCTHFGKKSSVFFSIKYSSQ